MSVWKVMSFWFSRELPLFNFERLDMLCAWIRHPSENVWPFWISRELLLFNLKHLDILCNLIGHPSEKLWRFKFLESFCFSILSFSIYYITESDIRVKSYDQLNFSRAYVVQLRASRYIMSSNRTSIWKVMTIWISREFSLSKIARLSILCPRIGHPCEKLWPVEFL